MNQGKHVFSQLMTFLPLSTFRRCVAKHRGHHKVQDFTCMDQFLTMAFAQLTYRESLCDIEVNLRAQSKRLYHIGLRCKTVSRNTLSNANATRPWQFYANFSQHLRLYRQAHHIFDQQLRSQARVDCKPVSPALAGRVVFQMDQAAPTNQDALWHQRERGQDANPDRGLHIRADRHCQETLASAEQSS